MNLTRAFKNFLLSMAAIFRAAHDELDKAESAASLGAPLATSSNQPLVHPKGIESIVKPVTPKTVRTSNLRSSDNVTEFDILIRLENLKKLIKNDKVTLIDDLVSATLAKFVTLKEEEENIRKRQWYPMRKYLKKSIKNFLDVDKAFFWIKLIQGYLCHKDLRGDVKFTSTLVEELLYIYLKKKWENNGEDHVKMMNLADCFIMVIRSLKSSNVDTKDIQCLGQIMFESLENFYSKNLRPVSYFCGWCNRHFNRKILGKSDYVIFQNLTSESVDENTFSDIYNLIYNMGGKLEKSQKNEIELFNYINTGFEQIIEKSDWSLMNFMKEFKNFKLYAGSGDYKESAENFAIELAVRYLIDRSSKDALKEGWNSGEGVKNIINYMIKNYGSEEQKKWLDEWAPKTLEHDS